MATNGSLKALAEKRATSTGRNALELEEDEEPDEEDEPDDDEEDDDALSLSSNDDDPNEKARPNSSR